MTLKKKLCCLLAVVMGTVVAVRWSEAAVPRPKFTTREAPKEAPAAEVRLPQDVVGVAHVGGRYNFTTKDYLNEGADEMLAMGGKVIKVWLTGKTSTYAFNMHWPRMSSLVDLAKSPDYEALFGKPFKTFILVAFVPGRPEHYYLKGMTPQDVTRESEAMFELTKYLLITYKGTGKTFVIQNWEGDWSLRGGTPPGNEPTPANVAGMIGWLGARQDGVERARKKFGTDRVMVLHAAEVNLVRRAMEQGGTTMTNDVLPSTKCDLYSYSAYDIPTSDPTRFREALDYLSFKAPASELLGAGNIYVGEFGAPENLAGGPARQLAVVQSSVQTALQWGVRYIVYWQLYCNEYADRKRRPTTTTTAPTVRPTNAEMKGFWLIRPDGSRTPTSEYFKKLWELKAMPAAPTPTAVPGAR
jgi:hypothetical protein